MKDASILPMEMSLVGGIDGTGDLRVFGRVEGAVQIAGDLVVEASGAVRGDLRARSITVHGIVVGDATAAETIRVEPSARVVGDLIAPRVQVADGAQLRGRVRVLGQEREERLRDEPRREAHEERAQRLGDEPRQERHEDREAPRRTRSMTPARTAASTPAAERPEPAASAPSAAITPVVAAGPRRVPAARMPAIGRARASRRAGAPAEKG